MLLTLLLFLPNCMLASRNAIYVGLCHILSILLACLFLFRVNSRFGSGGMQEFILAQAKPKAFLADVDYFCISDNYWVGKHTPCLTYGLRGLAYFEVGVQCSSKDLHSGVYGGSVHEAMTDLVKLMGSLVGVDGKILVPGVYDDVEPLTEKEAAMYSTIDFDVEQCVFLIMNCRYYASFCFLFLDTCVRARL